MKWQAKFIGRRKGALGLTYWAFDTVEGDDKEAARLKLYDKWEHIAHLTLKKIESEEGISFD